MAKYRCGICNRTFSTTYGLTQHRNAKHRGRTNIPQTSEQQQRTTMAPYHDVNLWNTPITMPESTDEIARRRTQPRLTENAPITIPALNPEPTSSRVGSPQEDMEIDEESDKELTTQTNIIGRYNLRSQVQDITE